MRGSAVRRRVLVVAAAALVAIVGLIAPQGATSAPSRDPRAERERVRAERAQVASQIDTSKASMRDIDQALQVLQDNLDTQEAALARTEAEVAQAEKDINDAEAKIKALTAQTKILKEEMRRRAVRAYVSPPADNVLTVLETNDFTTASSRKFYIELRSQDDADVADRLDGAKVDIAYQRRLATKAKKVAEAKRAEQAKRTDAVREAKAQKQKIADKLESTIQSQVARSLQLAKTDRALSAEIAQRQAALVARLAAQKASQRRAAAIAVQNAGNHNQAANGQESNPGGGAPLPGNASATNAPSDSGVALAYVQGIPVNAAVADQVVAMINAAAADGVSLRIGNSYRSVSTQIALRRQNCGSSYYAIYEMSSGSCHPPTAKPGQSQHQLGLAIDFANCSSRGSACYRWLAGNASRFGYYNLPSEAWHWSTTGR